MNKSVAIKFYYRIDPLRERNLANLVFDINLLWRVWSPSKMDRDRCRSQRPLVPRPCSSTLSIRTGTRRFGADQGISRSNFAERHHSSSRFGHLSTSRETGSLRRGDTVGCQHSTSTLGLPLPIYPWNWYHFVLRSWPNVPGRQYKEEEYSYAFR